MDDNILECLEKGDSQIVDGVLTDFNRKNSAIFSFPSFNIDCSRERAWSVLFSHLDNPQSAKCRFQCLTTLRILSRDKSELDALVTESRLKTLMKFAGLSSDKEVENNIEVIVECLKCLCNIFFNVKTIQDSIKVVLLGNLIPRLAACQKLPDNLRLFDMKLIFLLTALSPKMRLQMYEKNGFMTLSNNLEDCLNKLRTPNHGKKDFSTETNEETRLKLCSEILKTLFNVLLSNKSEKSDDPVLSQQFHHLVEILREVLLFEPELGTFKRNLQSDTINVLTLVPLDSLKALRLPGFQDYSGHQEMAAIDKIVNFLDLALNEFEGEKGTSVDLLSPVLLTLLNISKCDRSYRKYLRKLVLPNLTEVFKRPEEGNTLRNKLCRLLTSPVASVTELAADWLFVLCKESVGRMVKYTGYGNAAGLFARRGLLGASQEYSSDSSDSDTEEYLKHKHMINPVVGCRVDSHPNPLENMTYEQKEYLAIDLVNKIDKLQRTGIIQSCKMGKDGRPEPVEHILELCSDSNDQTELHMQGDGE